MARARLLQPVGVRGGERTQARFCLFLWGKASEAPESIKPQSKFTYGEFGRFYPQQFMSYLFGQKFIWKGTFQVKPDAKQFLFWPEMHGDGTRRVSKGKRRERTLVHLLCAECSARLLVPSLR